MYLLSLMKNLPSWVRSWALTLTFHAIAWLAILLGVYFSFVRSHWWPAAAGLIVLVAIEVFFVFKLWRRKPHFSIPVSSQFVNREQGKNL